MKTSLLPQGWFPGSAIASSPLNHTKSARLFLSVHFSKAPVDCQRATVICAYRRCCFWLLLCCTSEATNSGGMLCCHFVTAVC